MIRKIVIAALCLASAAFGQAVGGNGVPGGPGSSATLPSAGGIGYPLKSTAAGTTYGAQSPLALDPRDYGADFNGQTVGDASTTNGSNVITCPNSDCNFPSNIAGYIIFATAGNGTTCQDNASINFGAARQTTVTGFTNANSITVSGNSDTTTTATACLAWFPIDSTTALNAWWTAVGCGKGQMPAGKTLFSAPIMQFVCGSAANGGLGYPGPKVAGAGVGSTFLMPAPVFTYTGLSGNTATKCAVGNLNIEDYDDFAIWGLGERATGTLTNTCLFMVGAATRATNVDAVGWDARGGGASLIGVNMIGFTDVWMVGGANYFGSIDMQFSNAGQYVLSSYTSGENSGVNATSGVVVASGGSVTFVSNIMNTAMTVAPGGTANSVGSYYNGSPGDAHCIYSGGVVNMLSNDFINQTGANCTNAVDFYTTGSKFSASGSTIGNIVGAASNTFLDECGITFQGTATLNGMLWPLNCSAAGTAPVAANTVLGAGWGVSAAASAFSASADERHFTFTITNGASGVAQATATIAYTFPKAFQVAPGSCRAAQVGGTQGGGTAPLTFTTSTPQTATAVTFTSATIPTISLTEVIAVDCQ